LIDNDSGEVAAATRDAARADRYFRRGANRLRAAGQTAGRRLSSRSLEASRVVLVVE
jgi:hypothetical protein